MSFTRLWVILASVSLVAACIADKPRRSDDDDDDKKGATDDDGGNGVGETSGPGAGTGGNTATTTAASVTAASVGSGETSGQVGPGPSSGSGGASCELQPDYESCFECYCNEDAIGCEDYANVVITYLYCGETCSADCSAVCADPNATPTTTCSTCVEGIADPNPDLTAAQDACAANACIDFAIALETCPN